MEGLGDMKPSNHFFAATINMVNKFGSHPVGPTASTEKAIKNLLGNEVQLGACYLQKAMEDGCKKNEGHGQVNIQRMKGTGELAESCKQSSIKETSLIYGNQNADGVVGHTQSHEKRKELEQKVAPIDQLWDGHLQLNPSVTVSAVAFYQSGEKMPGVKWSESVEVKGKVKLEDFETYVQDVRRSPNRGLMVVSLRWKEGSSKFGVIDMKKVAERYIECGRVGLAKLLPGIDLYVCPRSDKIITILAKHGFFKGKRAIEVNKDSLVGCVVWKKNQVSCSSVEQKPERCTHQAAPSKVSSAHLPSAPCLESPGNNYAALDFTEQKDKIESDHKNLSKGSVLTRQSTSSISASVSAGPKKSYPDTEYQRILVGGQPSNPNLKPQRAVSVPPPPDSKKSPSHIHASEELPEFDFRISCGLISRVATNRAPDSLTVGKEHSDEGFRHMDGSLPQTVPGLKSWSASQKRRFENLGHQEVLSDDDTHKMSSLNKKVCRNDNDSNLPLVVGSESSEMKRPYSTPVAPPARNLFYDDNDMPEWCPPDLNLEKQLIPATRQFSNFPTHPTFQNPIHPIQYPAAQNHFSRAYAGTNNNPPFPARTPHFAFRGPVLAANQALPRPPGSVFGSTVAPPRVNPPLTNATPSGFYQNHFAHHPRNLRGFQIRGDPRIGNVSTTSTGMNCIQPQVQFLPSQWKAANQQ